MSDEQLDLLDRMTLRLWRISNLTGWWAAGAATTVATTIVWVRLAQRIEWAWPSLQDVALPFLLVGLAASGVPAGLLVGARVYRAPAVIGVLAVAVPASIASLVAPASDLDALGIGIPVVAAVLAGGVARSRFGRRPRALRAPR